MRGGMFIGEHEILPPLIASFIQCNPPAACRLVWRRRLCGLGAWAPAGIWRRRLPRQSLSLGNRLFTDLTDGGVDNRPVATSASYTQIPAINGARR